MIEENKLIAEFMGYTTHEDESIQGWVRFRNGYDAKIERADIVSKHTELEYTENEAPRHWKFPDVVDDTKTPYRQLSELTYHTSWSWLMPVIKKIVNLPLKPKNVEHLIVPLRDALLNVRIEDTHYYVVEFIKWYNENND